MIRTAIVALCLLTAPASAAVGGPFYVDPMGSDANDCLSAAHPCRTVQHAADLAPPALASSVILADGSYGAVNVQYYVMVNFLGNCADFSKVKLGLGQPTAVTVQDHAIVTLSCLSLASSSTGVYSRQFTITDLANVRCGAMAMCVSAQEKSKVNSIANLYLDGNMTYPFAAGDQSQIDIGTYVIVPSPITVYAFAWAAAQSLIRMSASISGASNVSGLQYVNDNSTIIVGGGLPGSAVGSICQHNCTME